MVRLCYRPYGHFMKERIILALDPADLDPILEALILELADLKRTSEPRFYYFKHVLEKIIIQRSIQKEAKEVKDTDNDPTI